MFELVTRMHFDAQADADDAYAQMQARAVNASVRTQAGAESLSYARLTDDSDGAVLDEWHTDTFGIVRDGAEQPPVHDAPEWIQPNGVQDAYPANDVFGQQTRVVHNGSYWINSHGDANTWEPGTVADTIWQEDGAVT
ncbi:MAG: hypothetical protein FKY71_18150 [Spiribacter salinus]|uniref:Uncharacterized protein n=1 Tax=Spiribacter salinus TaxID=1335746 RepID=A0A540V9X1_9GAMM|nr:MAG: hypothetical protein FKY71_18150 [Spiribacter salinus]